MLKVKITVKPKMARMSMTSGRMRANARERSRMHNLNRAIDRLRSFIPLSGDFRSFDVISSNHSNSLKHSTILSLSTSSSYSTSNNPTNKYNLRTKLSKIETLRLARNYLVFLTESANNQIQQNRILIGQILGYGLGQHSLNQIASLLDVEGSVRMLSQTPESVRNLFKNYCGTYDNTKEYSSEQKKQSESYDNQITDNISSIYQEFSYDSADYW